MVDKLKGVAVFVAVNVAAGFAMSVGAEAARDMMERRRKKKEAEKNR